jgi:hypothetical protein
MTKRFTAYKKNICFNTLGAGRFFTLAIIFLYLVSRARRQGKIRNWKKKKKFFLGFRGPAAVQNRPK